MKYLMGAILVLLFSSFAVADLYSDGSGSATGAVISGADLNANVNTNSQASVGSGNNTEGNDLSISVRGEAGEGPIESIASFRARVKTNLIVSNGTNGESLRVTMSNGRFATIKIMPETASAVAIAHMEAHCEQNNCTVELKEVGRGNNTRVAYEVEAEKNARVLGIFKGKMKVRAYVDAETGEVISVNRPWWAFLAAGSSTNAAINKR